MTIQQTELQVLANSKQAELTLITCDKPTHTEQRFVVKGKLVNQPVKTTKQTIMQQKSQIKEKNSQKNRKYCRMILILFLASLVIGTGIIIRISRK